MSFYGSQFHNVSNRNIDPALLEYDENNQNFAYDVEMAIDDHFAEPQDDFGIPFANATPPAQRGLNPEAVIYEPLGQQGGYSSAQPFETMRNEGRGSDVQTEQWRTTIAMRTPPRRYQKLPTRNSGIGLSNSFVPLTPEWQNAHAASQQLDSTPWRQEPCFAQPNLYPTPPDTGQIHRYTHSNHGLAPNLGPIPFPPMSTNASDGGANLSSMNLSTLSTDTQQSRQTAEWIPQSYNPGDRTRTDNLAPPPTPTRRPRGRSRAPSSISVLTCETCDKKFHKQHALDHHRRCHGDRNHPCPMASCDRAFVFHKDLVRHMAKHNKERHIFCNILGCKYREKGFGRIDHWKRHNEKKHPGNPWPTPTTSSAGPPGG